MQPNQAPPPPPPVFEPMPIAKTKRNPLSYVLLLATLGFAGLAATYLVSVSRADSPILTPNATPRPTNTPLSVIAQKTPAPSSAPLDGQEVTVLGEKTSYESPIYTMAFSDLWKLEELNPETIQLTTSDYDPTIDNPESATLFSGGKIIINVSRLDYGEGIPPVTDDVADKIIDDIYSEDLEVASEHTASIDKTYARTFVQHFANETSIRTLVFVYKDRLFRVLFTTRRNDDAYQPIIDDYINILESIELVP